LCHSKTDPPLILDKDAVLAFAIAVQKFKPITRQGSKIPKRRSGFQASFIRTECANSGEWIDPPSGSEVPGPFA
jgi:hypothetical protein